MKHLKRFKTLTDYLRFKNSDKYETPNISVCESGEVFYNVYLPPVAALFTVYGLDRYGNITSETETRTVYERDLNNANTFENINWPFSNGEFDYDNFVGYDFIIKTDFKDKITTIGDGAFASDSYPILFSGENITTISNNSFNCTNLDNTKTVCFDGIFNELTSIGDNAFNGCMLCTVRHGHDENYLSPPFLYLPNVTTIGDYAFSDTSGYGGEPGETIALPSLTDLGEGAFDLSSASSIYLIGDKINNVPDYTFNGCFNATGIIYGASNIVLSDTGASSTITIGGQTVNLSISDISNGANLVIADNVTEIGTEAFNGFGSNLINSYLRNGDLISDIPGQTVIGSGVTEIGRFALTSCHPNVIIFAETPPTIVYSEDDDDPFPFWEDGNGDRFLDIRVPQNSLNAYLTAWPNLAEYIHSIK